MMGAWYKLMADHPAYGVEPEDGTVAIVPGLAIAEELAAYFGECGIEVEIEEVAGSRQLG